LLICEYEFNNSDPRNPSYSLCEVDYYAGICQDKQTVRTPNHRLSMRKNLKMGRFEVYRKYIEPIAVIGKDFIIQTSQETIDEEVVFSGTSLEDAIRFADGEYNRYNGDAQKEPDELCQHKHPKKATNCPGERVSS